MEMLNDIISNEFIDDRLTMFLNILNGIQSPSGQPASPNTEQKQAIVKLNSP